MLSPAVAIIKRELLSTLRNPRYFRAVAALLFVLLSLLMGYFIQNPTLHLDDTRAIRELSTGIFLVYAYALYGIAALLLPVIASNAICSEKQQEQLDLLRMTYISPPVFLFAKAVNILGLYFFFAIATFPVASLLFYFTGVDWMQYGQMLTLISLVALANTLIGLFCSSFFYRTIPSAVTTFVLVFLAQWLPGGLTWWGVQMFGRGREYDGLWLALSPAWAIERIAGSGSIDGYLFPGALLLYFGGITLGCAFLAHRVLNRPTKPMTVNQEKTIEDPALLEARRKQFPYYLIDPRRRRPLIGDDQDPVLAKERYSSLANRGTTTIRILYSVAILSVILGAFGAALAGTDRDANKTIRNFVLVETLLLVALAPTFIATTFSKEHEWGNWDSLRMTLLTPRDVVWGKFVGALHALTLPTAALLIGTLPFLESVIRYPSAIDAFASSILLCGTCLIYVTALSIFTATRFERSLSALIATYGAGLLALVIGPMIIMLFAGVLTRRSPDLGWFLLSPLLTQWRDTLNGYGRPGFPTALVSMMFFLFLSLLLLNLAQRKYAQLWYAREPQHASPPRSIVAGESLE